MTCLKLSSSLGYHWPRRGEICGGAFFIGVVMYEIIRIPVYGIEIHNVDGGSDIVSDLKEKCPFCDGGSSRCNCCDESCGSTGTLAESEIDVADRETFNSRMDGIESLILAAYCAGCDVCSPDFYEAIETAVNACANN
jgi:hypothetical protein